MFGYFYRMEKLKTASMNPKAAGPICKSDSRNTLICLQLLKGCLSRIKKLYPEDCDL